MKYKSVFDIIGPIMIGPSSSHTAGAVKIGLLARKLFNDSIESFDIHFYGSFAQTYIGHATDIAVVGGLLGFNTDDVRIKESIKHAKLKNIKLNFISEKEATDHPNTVKIVMQNSKKSMTVTGVSLGGGMICITQLDGFPLRLSGENPSMLILHRDAYGAIASVTAILAKRQINISQMEVFRTEKGMNALMVIETDQKISQELKSEIIKADHVIDVMVLDA